MEAESPESGMEELLRLSQQFTRQEQEHSKREQQRAEQRKKVQDVLGGLKTLKIDMALGQLKMVAAPEIISQIEALKGKAGNEELRNLISDLAAELENSIGAIAAANPDIKPLESSIKTLTILIELFFSL